MASKWAAWAKVSSKSIVSF
jgi:hypothetical protein